MIPVGYEDFLDEYQPDPEWDSLQMKLDLYSPEDRSPSHDCEKCGEPVTDFELVINNGRCPGCDSQLVEFDVPF
jgi:formylmethanofuran dehydrogenase subunit E